MDCFTDNYKILEDAAMLPADAFLANEEIRARVIKGVKGMAMCIRSLATNAIAGARPDAVELAVELAKAGIIDFAMVDEFAELLNKADAADKLDPLLLYSDIVRFMEVFEAVYVAIKNSGR